MSEIEAVGMRGERDDEAVICAVLSEKTCFFQPKSTDSSLSIIQKNSGISHFHDILNIIS